MLQNARTFTSLQNKFLELVKEKVIMNDAEKSKFVVIIPAFNPDNKFIRFLDDLRSSGYSHIIVINDGSKEDKDFYFTYARDNCGCKVVTHSINLGQGRAYKTAFNYYLSETRAGGGYEHSIGIIQCDCDGQHHIEDINRCAELLNVNPEKCILGVRDFSDKSIPFRSRFGNDCTSFVFKFFCGLDIKDTQTGLKGIPKSFVPILMETPGERFEYASSVLLETKKRGVEILQFPIQTIYINGNETSHFNPLLDSIRIYSLIMKYLLSSLSSFIVDIALFSVFASMLDTIFPEYYIVVSTYFAKVFSCTYGYIVNRKLVFQNNGNVITTAVKFFLLCVIQSTCSGFITKWFVTATDWYQTWCKIIVDTLLFFISFQIQNRWVFKNDKH